MTDLVQDFENVMQSQLKPEAFPEAPASVNFKVGGVQWTLRDNDEYHLHERFLKFQAHVGATPEKAVTPPPTIDPNDPPDFTDDGFMPPQEPSPSLPPQEASAMTGSKDDDIRQQAVVSIMRDGSSSKGVAVFKVKTEQLNQYGVTMYGEVMDAAMGKDAMFHFPEGEDVEPTKAWTAYLEYGPKKSDPSQTVAKKVIKLEPNGWEQV